MDTEIQDRAVYRPLGRLWRWLRRIGWNYTSSQQPCCWRRLGERAVSNQEKERREETFVVIPKLADAASSTATFTLPDGVRVHTLDRAVFQRAVRAAEDVIDRTVQRSDSVAGDVRPADERP